MESKEKNVSYLVLRSWSELSHEMTDLKLKLGSKSKQLITKHVSNVAANLTPGLLHKMFEQA